MPRLLNGRIVVVGGFGYIGQHLVQDLCGRDWPLVVVAQRERSIPGCGPHFHEADVRDLSALAKVVDSGDTVVNLACKAVGPSFLDPHADFEVNALGGVNVLEVCRRKAARRVICVSSCEVYGQPQMSPIDEHHPIRPQSPYGTSKAVVENYAGLYRERYDVDSMVLRLFNVYGFSANGDPRFTVETVFAQQAAAKQSVSFTSHPLSVRDYVFVADVVSAIRAAIQVESHRGAYNIGSGEGVALRDIARSAGFSPSDSEEDYGSEPPIPLLADIGRARTDLSLKVTKSVHDHVKELRRKVYR